MVDYLAEFKKMYETFAEELKLNPIHGLIIDFSKWQLNTDRTGSANVWIQPVSQVLYKPTIQSHLPEIEIKGLVMTIWTRLKGTSPHWTVQFEMSCLYNPSIWQGRNSVSYHQKNNEIIVSGINTVVNEQDTLNSEYFLRHIKQNYYSYFIRCLEYHMIQSSQLHTLN